MTFISKAKTAAEFRQEVCDDLQRRAQRAFNSKRIAERNKATKAELFRLSQEFHLICDLRDFYKAMHVEGQPLQDPADIPEPQSVG